MSAMDIIDFNKSVPLKEVKIFLGDYDGIQRYDRYKYEYSEKLIKAQQGATWFPREISYSKDKTIVMSVLTSSYLEIYRLNLLFQTLADSLANRFLDNVLSDMVTSPEWEAILKWQAHFELIHSESYSWNIREVFPDPEAFFTDGFENSNIRKRLDLERATYKKLEEDTKSKWFDFLTPERATKRKKKAIVKALLQQYILENLRFMVSFLYTFKINSIHNQALQGSTNSIKLILNDEIIHTVIFANLINTLQLERSEGFTEIMKEMNFDQLARDMFDEVIEGEMEWFKYLSSVQHINGFTDESIREFLECLSWNALDKIGVHAPKLNKKENDIVRFFNKNKKINGSKALAQETDLLSYNIGVLREDEFHDTITMSPDDLQNILNGGTFHVQNKPE